VQLPGDRAHIIAKLIHGASESANLSANATNRCQKHGFNKMNCNLL
jgi:hypothetical protein